MDYVYRCELCGKERQSDTHTLPSGWLKTTIPKPDDPEPDRSVTLCDICSVHSETSKWVLDRMAKRKSPEK